MDILHQARLKDCRRELHDLLEQEKLAGASLLVLANKQASGAENHPAPPSLVQLVCLMILVLDFAFEGDIRTGAAWLPQHTDPADNVTAWVNLRKQEMCRNQCCQAQSMEDR